jgi:hypothetical protein
MENGGGVIYGLEYRGKEKLFHSFDKYLSAYSVPGTVSGARNTAGYKIKLIPDPQLTM